MPSGTRSVPPSVQQKNSTYCHSTETSALSTAATLLRNFGRIKASTIPDLEVTHPQDGSSDTVTTDAGKASTLNRFFVPQTCLHDPPQSFPVLPAASQGSPESFSTSPCEVYDILSHLKPGKAPGFDGLPSALLRVCASGISESLSTLFNRSFAEGAVPRARKAS